MTTSLPPDPTRDDDLPGEAVLKAAYGRLPTADPGPALDAAIRRAAAQAVLADAGPTLARRRRRWPIALGTAATVVLAAGLVWHMREVPTRTPSSASTPAAAAIDDARTDPAGTGLPRPQASVAPAMRALANPATMAAGQARSSAPPHPAVARRAPAPVAAPRASESMAPASTPAPAAVGPAVAPGPAMELDAIRALYARGQTVAADQRLRAFRDSHPDWPLPDDLRRHLDKTP